MTLTDFLLARIAEDEAAASLKLSEIQDQGGYGYLPPGSSYNPRVLAECEAKRRIVELHPVYRGPRLLEVDSSGVDFACEECHATSSIDSQSVIEALGWCDTLRILALPYSDHPDYREEWADGLR